MANKKRYFSSLSTLSFNLYLSKSYVTFVEYRTKMFSNDEEYF